MDGVYRWGGQSGPAGVGVERWGNRGCTWVGQWGRDHGWLQCGFCINHSIRHKVHRWRCSPHELIWEAQSDRSLVPSACAL
jgi:hypothetical protein